MPLNDFILSHELFGSLYELVSLLRQLAHDIMLMFPSFAIDRLSMRPSQSWTP
jgi:hypothetical protein